MKTNVTQLQLDIMIDTIRCPSEKKKHPNRTRTYLYYQALSEQLSNQIFQTIIRRHLDNL